MDRLSTLKAIQTMRDDSGHSLTTAMLYAAPSTVQLQTSNGEESIVIGKQQWVRGPKDALWEMIGRTQPFVFPDFGDYAKHALEVERGPDSTLNGQPVNTLTFTLFTYTGRLHYQIYGDPDSHRFQRLTMDGPGHHMTIDFVNYAPTVSVTPPPANLIAPTDSSPTP